MSDTLRDHVADQVAAAIDGCDIPRVYRRQVKATVLLALAAVPALSGDSGPGLREADRVLAVPHREDDQPCGCDACMGYGAEDEGFSWERTPVANRIVMRVLDSGDDRFRPLLMALRQHEKVAALAAAPLSDTAPLDVERLAQMRDVIKAWLEAERLLDTMTVDDGPALQDAWDAVHFTRGQLAAEYARLAAAEQVAGNEQGEQG